MSYPAKFLAVNRGTLPPNGRFVNARAQHGSRRTTAAGAASTPTSRVPRQWKRRQPTQGLPPWSFECSIPSKPHSGVLFILTLCFQPFDRTRSLHGSYADSTAPFCGNRCFRNRNPGRDAGGSRPRVDIVASRSTFPPCANPTDHAVVQEVNHEYASCSYGLGDNNASG